MPYFYNMEILERFANIEDGLKVRLKYTSKVKLTGGKKNPHQDRVTKVTEGCLVQLFKSGKGYFDKVNEGLVSEGKEANFEPGKRAWGERVEGTPFIAHGEKTYLECIFEESGRSKYFLDGEEIDKEEIEGLPEKKEGEQGGLESKVIVRTIQIDSILEVDEV